MTKDVNNLIETIRLNLEHLVEDAKENQKGASLHGLSINAIETEGALRGILLAKEIVEEDIAAWLKLDGEPI
jgi:hypothetical protein